MNNAKNFINKHSKKLIVGTILLVSALLIGNGFLNKNNQGEEISRSEITVLRKTEFLNSINESGNAVSETSRNIYPETMQPVTEINVEVGDKVNVGDIIARLDDTRIRQQLEQKSAMVNSTDRSSGAQIKNARDRLDQARRNLANGTNPQIVAAQAQVESARVALENARNQNLESIQVPKDNNVADSSTQINENITKLKEEISEQIKIKNEKINKISENVDELVRFKDEVTDNLDLSSILNLFVTDINSFRTNLLIDNEISLENKNKHSDILEKINNYKNEFSKQNFENKLELDNLILKLESSIIDSRNIFEVLLSKYDLLNNLTPSVDIDFNINGQIPTDLGNLPTGAFQGMGGSIEELENQYQVALKNLEIARISAQDEITALENNLNIAVSSGDNTINYIDIKYLNEEFSKTVIKSPVEGTITDVNMTLGQTPQDFVARVETIDELVIESQVKEYDINTVKVGMKVEITSDATNDDVANGKVVSINPTPNTPSGFNQQPTNTGEVTYDVLVTLDEDNHNIKPGMNVRVRYIVDRKNDVYVVPSNAVYQKGESYFMLVMDNENNQELREFKVEIKGENSFETVVSSNEIKDNMIVINAPDEYSPGTILKVVDTEDSNLEENE